MPTMTNRLATANFPFIRSAPDVSMMRRMYKALERDGGPLLDVYDYYHEQGVDDLMEDMGVFTRIVHMTEGQWLKRMKEAAGCVMYMYGLDYSVGSGFSYHNVPDDVMQLWRE
jgi:hypothetical protein